jgi:SlyX protein
MRYRALAMDTETRFIELETRYAHLERQVTELSEVVFEQQRALDALRAQVRMMNARVEQQGDAQANDKPPHY